MRAELAFHADQLAIKEHRGMTHFLERLAKKYHMRKWDKKLRMNQPRPYTLYI